jgi:hypothetical protein
MNFERQIKLVGAAQVFFGVVRLFGSLVLYLLFGSVGTVGSPLSSFLFIFGLVMSVPALAAGLGLLMMRPWARLTAVAIGAIELLLFPVGTILGAITLWLMAKKEVVALLSRPEEKEISVDDILAKMPAPDDTKHSD